MIAYQEYSLVGKLVVSPHPSSTKQGTKNSEEQKERNSVPIASMKQTLENCNPYIESTHIDPLSRNAIHTPVVLEKNSKH
jgi:hypothetical protein